MKRVYKFALLILIYNGISWSSIAQEPKRLAPNFRLQNQEGKYVSLTDYKGKVIYLDFWATWCKPCLEEVPGSIKLNKKLSSDTNIVFMAVSIDSETERWKQMLEKKKMIGVQLISIAGKESDVLLNYQVATIPRFIVIDKNGYIVLNNAQGPREDGMEEFLIMISKQD